MNRLRLIALTIAVLSSVFLLGIVNSSDAIEIVELRSYNNTNIEYDYGYPYFTFYVRTDKPYSKLTWYVYDVATEETRRIDSAEGDGVRKDYYFSISYLPGAPTGREYVIGVEAQKKIGKWMSFNIATYDFTVYTVPKTKTQYGNHTFAEMTGSVHVGWNGTKAEAEVSGSINTDMPLLIQYGISIKYKVIRLTPLGDQAAVLESVVKPILVGHIRTGSADFADYATDSHSDDYTLHDGGEPGETYQVQARVAITARYAGGDPKNQDELVIEDEKNLRIPRD